MGNTCSKELSGAFGSLLDQSVKDLFDLDRSNPREPAQDEGPPQVLLDPVEFKAVQRQAIS